MKKLLSLLLLLGLALPAQAMTTPLFSSIGAAVNTATRFMPPFAGGLGPNISSDSNASVPMPIAGTFSNLYIQQTTLPGGTATVQYILQVNGSSTASTLTCTLSATDGSCSDLVHSYHVGVGDTVVWKEVPTNAPVAGNYTLSAVFVGDTADETFLGGQSQTVTAGTTIYFPITGGSNSTIEASTTQVMPTNGTIDRLYCNEGTAPGLGNTSTVTLFVNDLATSLTCQITGAGVTQAKDITHTVSITAGDVVTFQDILSGSSPNSVVRAGVRFLPTIDGESPLLMRQGVFTNGTRFNEILGVGGNRTTEAPASTTVPIAFTLKKGYLNFDVQPGVGTSRILTARKIGVSQTLAPTVTGASFTGNDTTHSDTYVVGDFIDWIGTVTGVPLVGSYYRASAVAFISPSAAAVATHARMMLTNGIMQLINGLGIIY